MVRSPKRSGAGSGVSEPLPGARALQTGRTEFETDELGTKQMNGADVIAEILKREGTTFLACYPRNPLIEACAELDIRPILCRQERVGVGMADGYSRIRRGRQNGVFAAPHGPRLENALPGIAPAHSQDLAMLIQPARVPAEPPPNPP